MTPPTETRKALPENHPLLHIVLQLAILDHGDPDMNWMDCPSCREGFLNFARTIARDKILNKGTNYESRD